MRHTWIVLAALLAATPAFAQFNAYYTGTELIDGKEHPATARFSVEKGRVAITMESADSVRMLFLEKEGVLRVVNLSKKMYFDMDEQMLHQLQGMSDQVSQMLQSSMAQLTPEQRKMMESQMAKMQTHKPAETPLEYVWTKDTQNVKGYTCTRVEAMEGGVKRSEYWGTKSDDFKMTPDQRATMLRMQDYLRNFTIKVTSTLSRNSGGSQASSSRVFQWDTSVDGFPLISRCFNGKVTTLDLHLDSFDRKPLDKSLFEIPPGVTEQAMPTLPNMQDAGKAGGGRHHK